MKLYPKIDLAIDGFYWTTTQRYPSLTSALKGLKDQAPRYVQSGQKANYLVAYYPDGGGSRKIRMNPPMYAHHLNEIKAHGLSVKQLRRLYAMVSRGNQKAITFARNVLGIPFDETPSQVKAVVKHHVLDLAERKVRRNPAMRQGFALVRGGGPTGMKMVVVSTHKTIEGAETAMTKRGAIPNSQFTKGYSIHAFGPGTRYEYLDSEFTGKFLRPLTGNPSRTRYMLVERGTGKPISDVTSWGVSPEQGGYTSREVLALRKLGVGTKRFKTVRMRDIRKNPGAKFVFVTIHHNYFHWRTDDNRSGGQPFSSNSELKSLLLKLKSLLGLRKDQIEIRDERGKK